MKKIPLHLPQFENETALIIVTGTETGSIIIAKKGETNRGITIRTPRPRYSDREGFFVRTMRGLRLGAGSVYEDKQKEEVRKKFLQALESQIAPLEAKGIDSIYLFCPSSMTNGVKDHLSKTLQAKIRHIFPGNYTKQNRFALLAMIQNVHKTQSRIVETTHIKNEAQKILDRTKKIR